MPHTRGAVFWVAARGGRNAASVISVKVPRVNLELLSFVTRMTGWCCPTKKTPQPVVAEGGLTLIASSGCRAYGVQAMLEMPWVARETEFEHDTSVSLDPLRPFSWMKKA